MAITTPVPHRVKVLIVEALVKPELLTHQPGQPNVWGRELKLVTQLLKRYPDPAFWLDLHMGYQLNSFAFFLSERGAAELDHEWRMHALERAQRPAPATNGLDTVTNPARMDEDSGVLAGASPSRSTPVSWADGV